MFRLKQIQGNKWIKCVMPPIGLYLLPAEKKVSNTHSGDGWETTRVGSGLRAFTSPFSSFADTANSWHGKCANSEKESDSELKPSLKPSNGVLRDTQVSCSLLWGATDTRTWQSASEQTLPTADNSVPLLEPQKRHASELLVVGFPRCKQKREILPVSRCFLHILL